MRDIFICPHGNLLDNWSEAFPKALVSTSVVTVPVNEPVIFWLHANASHQAWLDAAIADVAKKFQISKIVVLANSPNQAEALHAISNGAAGYCHAYSPASVLSELKTVVMHGGIWLGRDLLQTLISASRSLVHNPSQQVEQALSLLTAREQEVALQAATGLSNKEIARKLAISERTVKAHISATLDKLGLKDRLQLALVLNDKASESRAATSAATQAASKALGALDSPKKTNSLKTHSKYQKTFKKNLS